MIINERNYFEHNPLLLDSIVFGMCKDILDSYDHKKGNFEQHLKGRISEKKGLVQRAQLWHVFFGAGESPHNYRAVFQKYGIEVNS